MSKRLILAEDELRTDAVFFRDAKDGSVACMQVRDQQLQHQRRIGAAVVLREMAAELYVEGSRALVPVEERFALYRTAGRLQAKARKLEGKKQ